MHTIAEILAMPPGELREVVVYDTLATEIPYGFLAGNNNITSVDFAWLPNVTRVCKNVLAECPKLTRIDLAGLPNVVSIGVRFLTRCKLLEHVDFRPMRYLCVIRNMCLSRCTELKTVALDGLYMLRTIGSCFAAGCYKLVRIGLRACTALYSLGHDFLDHASSLMALDLSDCPTLSYISNRFCNQCRNLERIVLPPLLLDLRTIGNDFCADCVALADFDFSALRCVYVIGSNFFARANSLRIADMSSWQSIHGLGTNAFYRCENIEMILIAFHGPALTMQFAANCPRLAHCRFVSATYLEAIGPGFLRDCKRLVDIDLSAFHRVRAIGMDFCAGTGVFAVDLAPLKNVELVEPGFFVCCPNL